MKYSKDDAPEAIFALEEFERLADEKLFSRRERYGPLRGDSNWDNISGHLLDEFAEFIVAMYGENWKEACDVVHNFAKQRFEKENSKDITTELFDIYNLAKLIYMVGRVQKVI